MSPIVQALLVELSEHADPGRAVAEKAYQKSDLKFLGVSVAVLRKTVKRLCTTHRQVGWPEIHELWSSGIWELRSAAVAILQYRPDLADRRCLPTLRRFVVESSGWAHNDWIGCTVLGQLVRRDPSALDVMDDWAVDENLWVRRAAMQSLIASLAKDGPDEWPRFVRYATPWLGAKDFWTRKAIGWVCREVSKVHPELVRSFIAAHGHEMSGLTLREAGKYLA